MHRVQKLSIWELGHRWYDCDPDESKTQKDISLDVKDLIRTLADEIVNERLISDLYRRGEGTKDFRKSEIVRGAISYYHEEFEQCIKHNKFDYRFLSQVFVEHQYLKLWCEDYNVNLPEFWYSWLNDDDKKN